MQPTNYVGVTESDIRVNIKGDMKSEKATDMNALIAPNTCIPAVYHSTGFLQSHNSHKRFLKMPRDSQCPFPGIMSIELAVFKATTVTKVFSKCHK